MRARPPTRPLLAIAVLLPFGSVTPLLGAEPVVPSPEGSFYGVALVATTLAYRAPGQAFDGPQGDLSPVGGVGYFLSDSIFFELDAGPTFVEGEYASFSLVPAVGWAFHPNFYAAARFIVPVHPEANLILLPALGATHVFDNGLAPFVELEILSAVGRGDPDFGVAVAAGATYALGASEARSEPKASEGP